jgi:ribosomal protein L7/L12
MNLTLVLKDKQLLLRALEMYRQEYRGAADKVMSAYLSREFEQEANHARELAETLNALVDELGPAGLENAVVELLRTDYQIINAIKLYRQHTRLSLKVSKDAVEAIRDRHGIQKPAHW